jgi:hypothetical protein
MVHEIRRIRVQRFFSLSDKELDELVSQHESTLHFLYEIYRRYGEKMNDKMKSAVAVYMLAKEADFEVVYSSLKDDCSNRKEVLGKFRKTMAQRKKSAHN